MSDQKPAKRSLSEAELAEYAQRVAAYLDEITAVSKKHGFIITSAGDPYAFLDIEPFSEAGVDWLMHYLGPDWLFASDPKII